MSSSLGLVASLATRGISTDERLKRLDELDLAQVRRKLQEPYPEGKGWTEEQSLEAEKWYKRYLATIIKYPDATQHVPNAPIDAFWHQHILDTMRYGDDCTNVLGYFLHHYPYFGLNGDAAERDTSFDDTNILYRKMFGEDCTNMPSFFSNTPQGEHSKSASYCSSKCRGCRDDAASRKRTQADTALAMNCNSAGSGTGCGQGCSRGK